MNETDPSDRQTPQEPRLYVVATSHLDTQWRWTVRDVIRKFLPRTLRENFTLFDVFPEYVLSFEGAFRYMLVEEYYPGEFERLKSWVKAGRWRLAGSMLDAPDTNLASAESMIRHILYATRYFDRSFGRSSKDIFLPDCFGFPFSLPTIAVHCGVLGFSSQKFGMWMAPADVPFDVGLWEGPDGAQLPAAIKPGGYGERLTENLSRSRIWHRRLRERQRKGEIALGLKYFGVGDRGGSPDEASLYWLSRSVSEVGPVQVVHSGSDQIFIDLREDEREKLPIHRGELLLPTHGTGCWTSHAILKRWNRQNELLADSAERAAVLASWLAQFPYPGEQLRGDWTRFLWHQMHDDLTGTSIPSAYEITWNDLALSGNRFTSLLTDAVSALSRELDTDTAGIPVVLFNPLAFARRETRSVHIRIDDRAVESVNVYDPDGEEVRSQVVSRSTNSIEVIFCATVPPLGLAVYEVRPSDRPCEIPSDLSVSEDSLENGRFLIDIDARGDIAQIYDKELGRDLLSATARLELLADRSPRWPAWEIKYETLRATPEPVTGPVERSIVEGGPARAALRLRRRHAGSTITQTVRLSAHSICGWIEIETAAEWRTRGRLLKARFPLAAENDVATYDLGCGVVERGINAPSKHEVPAHQWADVTDRDGQWGVSVLSDCKYGWDRPDVQTLRLSLLRSPRTVRKFPHQATQDFGQHRFTYAIYPHAGTWSAGGTVTAASQFNQRLLAFQADRHSGRLGRTMSLIEIDSAAVAVRAMKRAEEGQEIVLRLQESAGEQTRATIVVGEAIGSAREIDGCEKDLGGAQVEDGGLHTGFRPFEPKSFALRLTPPAIRVPPLQTSPVALEYDIEALSFHSRQRVCNFDGQGHSIPGELFPSDLMSGEIPFRLARSAPDCAHCVSCRGQELSLPVTDSNVLFLLATAAGSHDISAAFRTGSRAVNLKVHSWERPIGAWRQQRFVLGRAWGEPRPGWLVRTPVAWIATHRHDRRLRDQPYVYCYLFRYRIPLEKGEPRLILPNAPQVRIFAATLVRSSEADLVAANDFFG
jgi:alpha-mannosidase